MKVQRKLISLCSLVVLACASAAHASSISYWTASGTPDSDGPASASALISISNSGAIDVSLSSLLVDPHSAGQAVSGIIITLSNNITQNTALVQTGQLITISGNPEVASNVSGNPTHWGDHIGGDLLTIETAGPDAQGGTPLDMIVGAGNYATDYKNLNSSFTSNHLPLINGTGDFDLTAYGVTSNTSVVDVTFLFGTGPDGVLIGHRSAMTPEPSSLILLGTGLAGLGGMVRRRYVAARQA